MRWSLAQLPAVRAAAIAAAIAFGLVDGCPLPTPGHVPAWEAGFVEPIRAIRDAVETPVAWMRSRFQVTQQWALYQAPVADRFRMWIEGLAGSRWELLYRAEDESFTEDAAAIEHARVWGAWDPTDAPPAEYAAFAAWIGARALDRHAELTAVRVRMERVAIGVGEVVPSGRFAWPIVVRR